VTDVAITLAGPEDAAWITQTHAALYRRDEGFDASFEPVVAEAVDGFMAGYDPVVERAWLVRLGEARAGCLFLTRVSKEVARLRLFLLLPELRGQGVGRDLLERAMAFARKAGYTQIRVSTYDRHAAAGRLYKRSGFTLTHAKPARAFGHDMTEQTWEIAL